MDEVDVRAAGIEDFSRIKEIYEQVDAIHREAHPEWFIKPDKPGRSDEYLKALLDGEEGLLVVAERNRRVVGFAEAYIRRAPDFPVLKSRRWLLIDNIAVDRKNRRSGVGQKILRHLQERARALDIEEVELKVYSFNTGAADFYEKNGFREFSRTLVKRMEPSPAE